MLADLIEKMFFFSPILFEPPVLDGVAIAETIRNRIEQEREVRRSL